MIAGSVWSRCGWRWCSILYRFQVVVSDLVRAEDLQSAMTKQLEGRQREYERVLKENEELKASGEEVRWAHWPSSRIGLYLT